MNFKKKPAQEEKLEFEEIVTQVRPKQNKKFYRVMSNSTHWIAMTLMQVLLTRIMNILLIYYSYLFCQ